MPGTAYNSIKKPRTYEALRRRGYSKRSAARISNAQASAKDSGTIGLAIPPHGPDALFNQPGAGNIRTRRRKRLKALNWGAHGGQTIGGALGRGADGRFTNSGGAGASRGSAAQRQRRSEMRAKRQARADERAAAHEAERAQEETTRADEDAYIASGKSGRERQKRRAEIATKRRERAAARVAAHRQEAAAEREQRQQEDEAEAAQRETEGGKGGGGGGKKKPSDDAKQAAADKKKVEQRAKTAPKVGLSAAEAEALAGVAGGSGAGTTDTKRLRALGLMDDTGTTAAGRHLLAALERGDVRGALAAIQAGKAAIARDAERAKRERERATAAAKRKPTPKPNAPPTPDSTQAREHNQTLAAQIIRNMSARRARRRRKEAMTTKAQQTFGGTKRSDLSGEVFAGPDRSFPIKTAQDVRDAVRSLGRTKHDKAAVKRGIIRRARAIGAMDALPDSWKAQKSFAVFKDHTGADRWAAITTTAYEDKDQEWISCKAIRQVVAAGDASGSRGPLRYWHVPGLDLGDCDYQAALDGGRLLLESGTFRSPAAARIGQKAAERGYQMSPGFLHTRHEPRAGVFDAIAIFERSFVPQGRASNPYTWLVTKESRMLTPEKRKEFEALAGDDEGRALLTQLLATAETTTKAADEAGAVYKDAPPWATALITRIDGLELAVKAFPPADAAAGDTEATDDTEALDADLGLGDESVADEGAADDGLDDDGFADLIVQKLMAAIAPMLDLEKKMADHANTIKGQMGTMLGQYAAKKDDEAAQLKTQLGDLQTRLKALEGDQPRARASLAGGVWGDLTGIAVTKEQAAQLGAVTAGNQPPAGLNEAETGAYQLIFGDS